MNDCDLLKAYAETKSEEAFAELVRRYIDFVFSAALRQVGGDTHVAQDVVQCVFDDLARKAGSLSNRVILSGWLYTSARFAASKIVRGEQRRRARELESQFMHEPSDTDAAPKWDQLETVLDEAMHELKEADRNAILLRYFQGCEFRDVGERIGVSADSARMRVDRAIEKLRKNLAKRGVVSSAGALAAVITAQSITAAPVGLAAAVSSSAVTSAATVGAAATFFQFMAITKLQAGAIAVVVAALTVPIVMQRQANHQLEQSNQALVRQQTDAMAEIEPLKQEIARLNGLVSQNATKANSSNELFQLRAEVTKLREEARQAGRAQSIVAATEGADPIHETLRSLALRAEKLKQSLARHPESQIPELAILEQKDWLDAVSRLDSLDTEDDIRRGLDNIRYMGKLRAGVELQQAMKRYAAANNDAVPKDVSELVPYLEKPFEDSIFQRYKIVYSGKYSESTDQQDLIIDVAPLVDNEHETTVTFRRNGSTSRGFSQVSDTIEEATKRYAEANNGALPRNPAELSGLVPPTIEPERVQKFLAKIPANVTTWDQFRAAGRQ